jgi:CRISPR-associated Csx11 family protein
MDMGDLKKHERAILLAEVGTLIHDLGKLNKIFIDKNTPEGKSQYSDYCHSDILEYDSDSTKKYYPKNKILEKKAQESKKLLEEIPISFKNETSSLYQFIKEHHKSSSETVNAFIKLLKSCDTFDSEEDRSGASDMQSICNTYFSNAFGHEEQLLLSSKKNFEDEREIIYDIIIDFLSTCDLERIRRERRSFLKKLKNSLSKALGMTARAANDVSLWEHSYMSASIMKTLICESVVRNCFLIKEKKEISSTNPFKILSVYWDFFSFILQSHTIPDIKGRCEVLNEIKEDIKDLIETEYLVGNCIYEDEYGLHFLVPASFDDNNKDEIKKKIHERFNRKVIAESSEKLKGIITPYVSLTREGAHLFKLLPRALKTVRKRTETDFEPKWIEDWKGNLSKNKFICNLCGKGVYSEGKEEEICEICNNIRKIGRKQEKVQTIFIDEIAWNKEKNNYENVALFVLDFDLENWLNGTLVRTLLLRRYNEEDLGIIFEYCRKGKEIFDSFGSQGPLIGWIGSGSVEAQNKAKTSIDCQIGKYKGLGGLSRTYFGNIHTILVHIRAALDSNDRRKARNLLRKLNNEVDNIRNSIERIEEETLHPNPRFKSKEKRVFSASSDLTETKERIFLKNPSPSRLMRVWNNTREFFEEIEEIVCKNSYKVERYSLDITSPLNPDKRAYEIKIRANSKEIYAEGVFERTKIQILTPHANSFIKDYKKLKIEVTDKDWSLPVTTFACEFNNVFTYLRSYRIISISPSSFMFLVTACKTPEILREIKEKYTKVFGKVYGKLPLNINIIYFKRKTPFHTVLDSARRFLNHKDVVGNTHINKEFVRTEIRNVSRENDSMRIETDIGTTCIPIKLGNGDTDYYHPYIFIEDGQDIIEMGNYKQKHASLLKKGDKIKIYPSFFDFVFLDSNTRRFDIHIENRRRPHPVFEHGPRPYYLEDIDKFCRIWKILEKSCDNTQLNNFESLLLSKIEEWELKNLENLSRNEEFRKLTKASIENILRIKEKDDSGKDNPDFKVILDSVLSGMFFDVKELNHTILKRKLGGEKNE